MAESTQRLDETLKSAQPQIEWPRIAAFRNILVHNYLGMILEQIMNDASS